MSEEKKCEGKTGEEFKIKIPVFNKIEEAELENKLLFHLDEFTNEIMKTMTKDKDIIILKKVIERQQKEIEELKTKLEVETIDNKYNQEERDEETIPKYKIRELLAKHKLEYDGQWSSSYGSYYKFAKEVKELLEE